MNAEAFLSVYLKEIGVQTPISSFLGTSETKQAATPDMAQAQQLVAEDSIEWYATHSFENKQASVVGEPELTEDIYQDQSLAPMVMPVYSTAGAQGMSIKPPNHIDNPSFHTTAAANIHALKAQASVCSGCELSDSRNHVVFGSGSGKSGIVFIGDSPSRAEDLAGEAMVGKTGALFNHMLQAVGFARDDVYVMHGVKCRASQGRDPKPMEFAACEQWLIQQIDFLQPRLICLLGRIVGQSMLNTDLSLAELRQQEHLFRGIPVMVLDHPTFLLRSPRYKARAWVGLNKLKDLYQSLPGCD